jgi:hypothetical protein
MWQGGDWYSRGHVAPWYDAGRLMLMPGLLSRLLAEICASMFRGSVGSVFYPSKCLRAA